MHSATELRYSVEAQLVFAYKWKFRSMLRYLKNICRRGDEFQRAALESFEKRLKNGELEQVKGNTSAYKNLIDRNRFLM